MTTKKKAFCFRGIIGHLMILLGIYLVSAGLIDDFSLLTVLKGPIFWGIFLIIVSLMYTLKPNRN